MINVTPTTLRILAAAVWYAGGISLSLKAFSLLRQGYQMKPELLWPSIAIILGLVIGGLKGRFVFTKSCRKNLTRIYSLESPKIWQFFRGRFFIALAAMIAGGKLLSYFAQGSYPGLIAVGCIDLSLATGLLGSSYLFWVWKPALGK